MLAHLSYSRDEFIAAGNAGWPVAQMTVALLKQFEVFLAQLPPQAAEMFPGAADLAAHRVLFEGLASTESTVFAQRRRMT
jgi:hypothetical protein